MITRTAAPPTPSAKRFRLLRDWRVSFGLLVLGGLIFAAIFSEQIVANAPTAVNLRARLAAPSWIEGGQEGYLFGADAVGRDVLSRVLFGSRVSLVVGALSVVLAGFIGTTLGILAGFFGKRVDTVISGVIDIQMSFPFVLLAIFVASLVGPSLRNVILVLGVAGWPHYARIARGEVLSIRNREYVGAAIALGAGKTRLLARTILPNILAPLLVLATLSVPRMILTEASLSFLGIGVPPPTPSWGGMIADARSYMTTAWWIAAFPGVFLVLCVLSINLLGDGLRDELDPREYG